MIKRMADKIGHFGHQKQSSPRGSLAYTPSQSVADISVAADYHRGSISTERTSSSEWSKRGDSFETESLPMSLPRVSSRPNASYKLSDFIIQRTLGTGSFGRVHLGIISTLVIVTLSHLAFLVMSRHNHRFYAVKVLNKEKIVRTKQVEHTNNEKMMLEAVQHPFIINLWGAFQDASNLYMVMDFVPGGELFTLLRRSNVSPLENFIPL